jgi:radical SAM protein with 4Fe4S-binding SPASM domain
LRPRLQSLIYEVTPRCNHACLHCYNIWAAPPQSLSSPFPFPQVEEGGNTGNLGIYGSYAAINTQISEFSPPSLPVFGGGRGGTQRSCVHGDERGELNLPRSLALLSKALDEIDCPHVTLTGGEPLLRPDLPQMVDFLRQRGVQSTIISNGRLLSEERVVELLECGVGLFELPLLSYRREVHDHLSGAPGAFDAALAAMARIRHHGGQFVAVFVATRLNLPDLYDTLRLAYAFGARGMMLNRFNVGGRGIAHVNELLPSAEELRLALSIADKASAELGFSISCSIPIQPCLIDMSAFPRLGFGFCAAGTERAYYTLDPTGNLRPCNHTTTILGNLFDEPFTDLIASARLSDFCRALPDFCKPCSQRETCQGGCKAAAQVCFQSLSAEEPFLRYNRGIGRPIPI